MDYLIIFKILGLRWLEYLFWCSLLNEWLLIRKYHGFKLIHSILYCDALRDYWLSIFKFVLSNCIWFLTIKSWWVCLTRIILREWLSFWSQVELLIICGHLCIFNIVHQKGFLALVGNQWCHRPMIIFILIHLASIILLLHIRRSRLHVRHCVPRWLLFLHTLHHLREIEFRLFALIRLPNATYRLLWNRRLIINIDLLPLEFQVGLNHSLDRPHVRTAVQVEGLDKLGDVVWILPLFDSFKQAEVHQNHWGSPRDTRGAVNVDC